MDIRAFQRHLEWAEARRQFPYEDSAGLITIGVGRNLEHRGLSEDEIDLLLTNDINSVLKDAKSLEYWKRLNSARQLVIADMIFNVGLNRFLGFVKTQAALEANDYEEAARQMEDSKWYRQVGRRAVKLVETMRSGVFVEEPK